jgi:hypothetical protein
MSAGASSSGSSVAGAIGVDEGAVGEEGAVTLGAAVAEPVTVGVSAGAVVAGVFSEVDVAVAGELLPASHDNAPRVSSASAATKV